MRKITGLILAVIVLLCFAKFGFCESITLDSPETLATPSAARIGDWEIIKINADRKLLAVQYSWRDSSNDIINMGNGHVGLNVWYCRDIETPGENANCVDVDDPYDCCTGVGTGTCDGMDDTCFTDVFGFNMRAEDVGTAIGVGLRQLIWNKMKADILTGINDGDFD